MKLSDELVIRLEKCWSNPNQIVIVENASVCTADRLTTLLINRLVFMFKRPDVWHSFMKPMAMSTSLEKKTKLFCREPLCCLKVQLISKSIFFHNVLQALKVEIFWECHKNMSRLIQINWVFMSILFGLFRTYFSVENNYQFQIIFLFEKYW